MVLQFRRRQQLLWSLIGLALFLSYAFYIWKVEQMSADDEKQYSLTVMTMLKNKAEWLPEWLEFHLLQGVDRFIIYDHNSTDNLKEILQPYVGRGVVELVRWPDDHDRIESRSGLKRDWFDWRSEDFFNRNLKDDCIHLSPSTSKHKQVGCQLAAFTDAVARYRHKTEWLGVFDVDEFMFLPSSSPFASEPRPLVRKLDSLKKDWIQVQVLGTSLGTQGFYDDPPGLSHNLPFSLVTEFYRYRGKRHQELVMKKSFAQPNFVIHGRNRIFNISVENATLMTSTEILFNHYQYRSLLNCHRKALDNWNPSNEYNSTLDLIQAEEVESDILQYIPKVKQALQLILETGVWSSHPPTKIPATLTANTPKIKEVCIVVMNFHEPIHHMRRAISTMKLHMDTYEPTVGYEFHTFILLRESPIWQTNLTQDNIASYLPDVLSLSRVVVLHAQPSYSELLKTFVKGCAGFNNVLILGEKMETRVAVPGSLEVYSLEMVHDSSIIRQAVRFLQEMKPINGPYLISLLPASSRVSANNASWEKIPNDMLASKLRYYQTVNITDGDLPELEAHLMKLSTLEILANKRYYDERNNSIRKSECGMDFVQITFGYSLSFKNCESTIQSPGLVFSN